MYIKGLFLSGIGTIKKMVVICTALIMFNYSNACQKPPSFAIATASKQATAAGIEILKKGGNAFDAAITVSSMLSVTEPFHSGIGGGGFWLIYDAGKNQYIFIDSREVAPQLSHKDMYIKNISSINGPMASAIPGTVAGWNYLFKNFASLPLPQLLEASIKAADKGFAVDHIYHRLASRRKDVLSKYLKSKEIFLNDKLIAPQVGEKIVQKQMAKTLRELSERGLEDFYTGNIAAKIIQDVKQARGIWQKQDLENYKVRVRKPLIDTVFGYNIITAPPPSAGGISVITMLKILEKANFFKLEETNKQHYIIESMKKAYLDRFLFLGDPDFISIPTHKLIDEKNIEKHFNNINPALAATAKIEVIQNNDIFESPDTSTTHFSIVDKEGNIVSATLTINGPFGSGFTSPSTGILLNNEMDDFTTELNKPNSYGLVGNDYNKIEPNKRPVSSMTPTILSDMNKIAILGTPGGSKIPTMVLLGIMKLLEGSQPDSWVSKKRFHHQYLPDIVNYEDGALSPLVLKELHKKGHKFSRTKYSYGNMQAVLWDKSKASILAASDNRGNGLAYPTNKQNY